MRANRHEEGPSVVVPAIDVPSSTACVRALGREGVRTIAVSEREDPPAFRSRYVDETVSAPDPTEDLSAYARRLLGLAEREDVCTVIPLREPDVYALAAHRSAFADHVGTPWPSLDTLRGAQDRVELFAAAERAGVPAPETRRFDDWTTWDEEVIVKARYTLPTAEYVGPESAAEYRHGTTRYVEPGGKPDRDSIVAEMGHVPIVQEYVPGNDEYGFFALYDEGEALATFQHRQLRGYKYCGGPSAYRESVDIPALEAAGLRLLDELDWHGLAMVEFLHDDETGEFELMEVNPRFWSSLPFTVQAGVDFPNLYRAMAAGERPATDPDYEVGVAGHLLRGELLHLHSVLFEDYPVVERPSVAGTAAATVASVVRHPQFDYLSADDVGPFLRDVAGLFEAAIDEREQQTPVGSGNATRAATTLVNLLRRG
ncbi:carboxylate--amine ligase [Halorussus marinus]|uniref:carboxylate--amine ligase n=1 Tax=Halorussus marinus TaxID=2505976 RepID=UPI001B2FEBCD|nr:carboxylate--amine ligase [Halorussus marinus]